MEGACPEIMKRLEETNLEHTVGYGFDQYTESAKKKILEACGLEEGLVFFLVGGTQTNSTILDCILRQWEGVIAPATAHIAQHEAGAVEASGHKVMTLEPHDGKIWAADVENYITEFYKDDSYEHMVAPGAVYISQPTEFGTLYTLEEMKALSEVCRSHDVRLYVDGARLGYALAAENNDLFLEDIASLADAFYIGGTKCGALFGEAVVIPDPDLVHPFLPRIKRHGALLAKGRILGVQFDTLFTDGLYVKMASRAVRLALQIKEAFSEVGYEPYIDSPTNQQFFKLPNEVADRLRSSISFENWGPRGEKETVVRFVTSWATTPEDVDTLCACISQLSSL